MRDFIMGWILSRQLYKEPDEESIRQANPNCRNELTEQRPRTVYEHWAKFDNLPVTLEDCYDLYEHNNICHIKDGDNIRVYYQYDVKEFGKLRDPKNTFDII